MMGMVTIFGVAFLAIAFVCSGVIGFLLVRGAINYLKYFRW